MNPFLVPTTDDTDDKPEAICAPGNLPDDLTPDAFFPPDGDKGPDGKPRTGRPRKGEERPEGSEYDPYTGPAAQRAIALCRRCPIQADCLEDSLTNRHSLREGIWGGSTPEQRKALVRARKAAEAA